MRSLVMSLFLCDVITNCRLTVLIAAYIIAIRLYIIYALQQSACFWMVNINLLLLKIFDFQILVYMLSNAMCQYAKITDCKTRY